MRLIHCADLHLDSKMNANLDKDHARVRKSEILHTFERMVAYAAENQISAILIAGDLFDTKNSSATARNTVLYNITSHPEIRFYYLRGNHDVDNFISGLEEIPDNLKLFSAFQWTTYEEAKGKVTISGLELSAGNTGSVALSLVLNPERFNIVMLHGQEAEGMGKDRTESINLKLFRNKGIDYLALGHIHAYKKGTLDARGTYCYSGCLEGRGFDECGEHGFVVLDIEEATGKYTQEFIPFAQRKLYTVNVDVTGSMTTAEMAAKIMQELQRTGCEEESLVKIVLSGTLDVECEKNLSYLTSRFRGDFFFLKVSDETTLRVNLEQYMSDVSLKGEFIRQVMADDSMSEEEKSIVIRYGLQAIAGEEVQ